MNINLHELHNMGWIKVKNIKKRPLIDYAKYLGFPIGSRLNSTVGDILKPLNKLEARKSSMSEKHGLGAFPLHTDCAYYEIPPRYILFQAINPDITCATTLLKIQFDSLSKRDLNLLKNSICFVQGTIKSFLTPYLKNNIFRWDINCIIPQDRSAKKAFEVISEYISASNPIKHYWKNTDEILIVDNWQVVHGRESCNEHRNRQLERILVKEK